jgi:Domain of unknown function (DUF5615)
VAFPIYFDDDSEQTSVVQALIAAGHEAHTPRQEGSSGIADEDHLSLAASRGWAILTRNLADFLAPHAAWMAEGRHHSGVILIRQKRRPGVGEQVRSLLNLLAAEDVVSMRDTVVWLSNYSDRA